MNGSLVLLAQADAGGGLWSFFPLILVFLIFYLLVFRPQIKRQKQHQALLKDLKKGDEVITQGGILGKIVQLQADVGKGPQANEGVVVLDIGEGGAKIRIRILKSQVMSRLGDEVQAGAKSSAKSEKEETKPVSSEPKPVKE